MSCRATISAMGVSISTPLTVSTLPKDVDIAQVGSEFAVWHDPSLGTQKRPDPLFLLTSGFCARNLSENLKETTGGPGMQFLKIISIKHGYPNQDANLDVLFVRFRCQFISFTT